MQTFRQLEIQINQHQERRTMGRIQLGRILQMSGKQYAAPILEEIRNAPTIEWLEEMLTLLREGDAGKGIKPAKDASQATWEKWIKAAEIRANYIKAHPPVDPFAPISRG